MGVAALVLGIVSVIIAIIPFCGSIAFIPAIIGLILGIVDTVQKSKKQEKKGLAVAGIVLNAIAIVFIAVYTIIAGAAVNEFGKGLNEAFSNSEFVNEFKTSLNEAITNSISSSLNNMSN